MTLNVGLALANAFSCFLTRALAIFTNRRRDTLSLLAEFQFLPAGCYLTSLLISWLFSKPIRKEFTPPFAQFLDMLPTSVTQRSTNVIQSDDSVSAVLSHTAPSWFSSFLSNNRGTHQPPSAADRLQYLRLHLTEHTANNFVWFGSFFGFVLVYLLGSGFGVFFVVFQCCFSSQRRHWLKHFHIC